MEKISRVRPIIDADTHVIETEGTWRGLSADEERFRPVVLVPKAGGAVPSGRFGIEDVEEWWAIDGRVFFKKASFTRSGVPDDARDLWDIKARLEHMDELGVDIHVIYPTLLVDPFTRRPEVEVALCRSYNRWIAELSEHGGGRLRWIAPLPVMDMAAALEELSWCRTHGACGVLLQSPSGERLLSEPYFFPLYERLGDLDLPVCVHNGSHTFTLYDLYSYDPFSATTLPVIGSFHDLVMKGIPAKFPSIRWAFIEVGSQWLPFVLKDLETKFRKRDWSWPGEHLLQENNLYVACQSWDDLTYVTAHVGAENLIIGSDYGHNDTSSELRAIMSLRSKGDVDQALLNKILSDNPRRLYGLE